MEVIDQNTVSEALSNLKAEILMRKNRKVNMKLKTFLSMFGYKRRTKSLINSIVQGLNENEIVAYANRDEEWYWDELLLDDRITFELKTEQSKPLDDEHKDNIINNENETKGTTNLMYSVENVNAGSIRVVNETNPINLYLHQIDAIQALDNSILKKDKDFFGGLLVIPTGGGKTLTAVQWLLRNIIDQGKKVLWIAHRHELLEQALSAVKRNSYSSLLKNKKDFRFRIISGQHDKPVNIRDNDDLIIASKDSLNRGMDYLLKNWIGTNSEEVFLVIDEAHHATAKTYRRIIDELKNNVHKFKMLGLTATPFRTFEDEKGLLKKIFLDDIVYKIDLRTLISRGILSEPIFKEFDTNIDMSRELNDKDIKAIQTFGELPEDIAEHIAINSERNKQIVMEYVNKQKQYGKLLVFAINKYHAIELNKLFKENGIASEFVISGEEHMFTGAHLSNEANKEKIQRFRDGSVDVLININILTEGTDLPDVQTVFLTRPTISSILMTQMIGRALRGVKAGGTEKAYIVSFIDNWKDKIAWVNPEKLYIEETADFNDNSKDTAKKLARLISIEKIEEFTKIMDEAIDTTQLERITFLERVPIGIYSFTIVIPSETGDEVSKNCEILIYDSTKNAYESFISDLKALFEINGLNSMEFLTDKQLDELCDEIENEYFKGYDMIPGYRAEDIKDVLRYYALKGVEPLFLNFADREKLDLTQVAKYIYENELGGKRKKEYIDSIWDDESNFFKVYFDNKYLYFRKQLDIEILKIEDPDMYSFKPIQSSVTHDKIDIKKLSLHEIEKIDPKYYRELKDEVFNKSKDKDGYYTCAISGFKSTSRLYFQIDHIKPMAKGGLTELGNLQVLKREINLKKSDKWDV